MVLADTEIIAALSTGALAIDPLRPESIQPASVDLTLSSHVAIQRPSPFALDVAEIEDNYMNSAVMRPFGFVMEPGEFLLGCTNEAVKLGPGLAAQLDGISSVARLGLLVHVTGGFIDPGFEGQITLEMHNLLKRPLRIRPNMRIAQLVFSKVHGRVSRDYSQTGRYQGQTGPTLSRYEYKLNGVEL